MLKDRLYTILGGSSGIGLATAETLIAKGASVIIVGRNLQKLNEAKKRLGDRASVFELDIAEEKAVSSFFNGALMLDGIVCTAGETPPGSVDALDVMAARRGFDSKFWGQYFVVKYGHKKLKPEGSIVLTTGVFSVRPVKDVGILAAVNGAIESFVRAMAVDLAPIRINALAPGLIETPRLKKVSGRDADNFAKRINNEVPLKRVGEANEVAESMLYLLTNSYTTGTTLYVDGGITLR